MGHKGMFSKCNMYGESLGIPMILSGPDLPKGQEIDTPTQLMDIFPTILEATGVTQKDEDQELEGESLISLAEGEVPDRSILSEQHSAGAKSAVYMIRKGKWKYVHYAEGYSSHLFDLESDPQELKDLGNDPEFTDQLNSMEKELRTHLDPEKVDQKAKGHIQYCHPPPILPSQQTAAHHVYAERSERVHRRLELEETQLRRPRQQR